MGIIITSYSQVELIEVLPDLTAFNAKYPNWEKQHLCYIQPENYPSKINYYIDYRTIGPIVRGGVYGCKGEQLLIMDSAFLGLYTFLEILANRILQEEVLVIRKKPKDYEEVPFFPLLNFPESGVITQPIAQLLVNDFKHLEEKATYQQPEFFIEKYNKWRTGCELAAQNGLIEFR